MGELLDLVLTTDFLVSAVAFAAPLIFAALGGILSERAGVINIGLEGMMLAGAFGGVWGGVATGNIALAVLAGALAGVLFGFIHAVFTVTFRGNHVVSGIAINILSLGLTGFLSRQVFETGSFAAPPRLGAVRIPLLADIPVVGEVLFSQSLLFYALIPLVAGLSFLLARTRWGLVVRATGESARVAATAGINPVRVRYLALLAGGALAALGGVFLALVHVGTFQEGISGGRGFIALAAVIFAGWRPGRAIVAALLFGAIEALGFRIQIVTTDIPFQFVGMLPHIVTLLVFAGLVANTKAPGDLGAPLELR